MSEATRPTPEFPDLLRNWRKLRKVSQGSLALCAGVSQRHLSFLESGRSSPSRQMVTTLAQALELPMREENSLLNAAGYAAIHRQTPVDNLEMKHARQALDVLLKHHEPYPAVVLDRNWNLLMMNDSTLKVFSKFINPATVWEEISPGISPNLARLSLHPAGLRGYIENWQPLAAYFLNHLTTELSTNPYNRGARELLDELSQYADMPAPGYTGASNLPYMTINLKRNELDLSFFTLISTFGTPQDITLQEIRIETFFAANAETDAYLNSL